MQVIFNNKPTILFWSSMIFRYNLSSIYLLLTHALRRHGANTNTCKLCDHARWTHARFLRFIRIHACCTASAIHHYYTIRTETFSNSVSCQRRRVCALNGHILMALCVWVQFAHNTHARALPAGLKARAHVSRVTYVDSGYATAIECYPNSNVIGQSTS